MLWSIRMMEPFARCTWPFIAATSQFQSARSPVMPRLRTMFVNFLRPGIFRTVPASAPLRYSITAISTPSPETSLNEPRTARPSSLMPWITTWNMYDVYGSSR